MDSGHAVAPGGAEPIRHDGAGQPGGGECGPVPNAGAVARPLQGSTPLRRGQAGQQIDEGVAALGLHADV